MAEKKAKQSGKRVQKTLLWLPEEDLAVIQEAAALVLQSPEEFVKYHAQLAAALTNARRKLDSQLRRAQRTRERGRTAG